jgi:replicative DNA helicase
MSAELVRVPPHSSDAEQSLLGALLLNNAAWERVADILTSRDFYKGNHRVIYEHIELVMAADQPADVVTVSESLTAAGVLDQAGGVEYLAGLTMSTPSATNVRRYAELVREKAVQRNLIRICSEVMDKALNPGAEVDVLIEEAEKRIFDLRQKRTVKKSSSFPQLLSKVFESIDNRFHSSHEITGLHTGFSKLDEMTAGLQPGDLIIVAGRPSMGKTALAMNIAEYCGLEVKRPVAVFSLEMADEQLVQRMLGSVGRVDQHRLRTGKLTDADWGALSAAVERLHGAPFIIEETMGLSITELRARARRIARDNPGLALIVIDYLQLMATHAQSQADRTAAIGEISRGLKAIAKELAIPVIALSQLNRGVESRIDKRPTMADLRESGAIEQDADLIAAIYRDEVYNEDSTAKGYAEVMILKQRNGPIGHFFLRFVKEETRFESTAFVPEKKQRKKKGFVERAEEEVRRKAEEVSQ